MMDDTISMMLGVVVFLIFVLAIAGATSLSNITLSKTDWKCTKAALIEGNSQCVEYKRTSI